ncbi:MAG: lycopene cyclase domain-containing protein [Halodesulfurarchaeum sp.]
MTGLTYLQFHLGVLVVGFLWLVPVTTIGRHRTARPLWEGRAYWVGVAVVTVIALLYTIPWDNYLIARGVWWYGEERVLGQLWLAPIEEYLFILAQPVFTALWASQLPVPDWRDGPLRHRPRLVAGGLALGIGLAGVILVLTASRTLYLGAILAWAAPVLLVQWVVGAPQLLEAWQTVVIGVLGPTLYLWVADRIALSQGIWVLSETYTTGLAVGGLPIEEATFFLVTNLFVLQGLVLFRWVLDRWGIAAFTESPTSKLRTWVSSR